MLLALGHTRAKKLGVAVIKKLELEPTLNGTGACIKCNMRRARALERREEQISARVLPALHLRQTRENDEKGALGPLLVRLVLQHEQFIERLAAYRARLRRATSQSALQIMYWEADAKQLAFSVSISEFSSCRG